MTFDLSRPIRGRGFGSSGRLYGLVRNLLVRLPTPDDVQRRDNPNAVARPVHAMLASTQPVAVATPSTRHGTTFPDLDDRYPVMVVSADRKEHGSCRGWFEAAGHGVESYYRIEPALDMLVGYQSEYALLILDLDTLGGISRLFDSLRLIRECAPTVPVIILSEEFSSDDFSVSRLAVADVSLRKPLGLKRLEVGVTEAAVNNVTWQGRRADLARGATAPSDSD